VSLRVRVDFSGNPGESNKGRGLSGLHAPCVLTVNSMLLGLIEGDYRIMLIKRVQKGCNKEEKKEKEMQGEGVLGEGPLLLSLMVSIFNPAKNQDRPTNQEK